MWDVLAGGILVLVSLYAGFGLGERSAQMRDDEEDF